MEIKAGMRLACPGSTVELVVVRPPSGPVEVACGGVAVVEAGSAPADARRRSPARAPLVGKRYADEDSGLEVLCSKAGAGALTCDGREMPIKGAKPLPSSD